ncbi:MAG: protein kinase [Acidobacteria bacterium]|nr:protein kinase [Acidobacteriota bacterium]
MDAANWAKVKEVLDQTVDLDQKNRSTFLEGLDISPDIRAEVESLLAQEVGAENIMQLSAVAFSRDFIEDNALVGQEIGAYKVIGELGNGGMGAVYLGERTDGKFTQRVALKLLRREMNTGAIRRRFRREREILASLDHTNIARLLDAGTTSDKIPFLAMEYVDGLPIDEYCDRNELGLEARLDLFRKVCSVVDFAHRSLVVHRDLKPSNILVTADGTPKLLDFGISKIVTEESDNTATVTRLGVMTPSYAAPEQLRNKSVTTAADIYSLGVILYQLLSGHRPFESKESDLKEILKAVTEVDPPLPSAVAHTETGPRAGSEWKSEGHRPSVGQTEPVKALVTAPRTVGIKPQHLRGDLDNIVLKALKKEPERRYLSAESFSEDIGRHLSGLPVTARPDTFSYRAEKFVKRNSVSVVAAGAISLAIIGGVVATLWQASVARAERTRAEKRFNDVRKLANSYLFDVYPEIENLEGSLKARETILKSALEYLDSLSMEVGSDLALQSELATAYEKVGDVQGALNNSSLGNIKAGLESYEKARRLRETVYTADPSNLDTKEKLANNYYTTARTLWNNSQTKDAEEVFEKGLKLRRELAAAQPDSVEAKNRLAVLLVDYGAIPAFNFQAERGLVLYTEASAIINELRTREPENADFKKSQTRMIRSMSKVKTTLGDYESAFRDLAYAVDVSKELALQFPKDFRVQRSVWLTESIICEAYIDKADRQKVVDACTKIIDFPTKALEKEPENGVVAYDLAISHFNLSRAYRINDDPVKTIASAQKAIKVMSALIKKDPENGEYNRNLAVYQTEIGRSYMMLKQYDKAVAELKNVIAEMISIAEYDKATTTYQYDLAIGHRLIAESYFKSGNPAAAVENTDKAITLVNGLISQNAIRESDKKLLTELEQEKLSYSK